MILFKRQSLFLFALLVSGQFLFAQKRNLTTSDSLSKHNYQYFKTQIALSEKDSLKLKLYPDHFIQKARKENNLKELFHYYRYFHFYHPDNKHLVYADSAIYYAKKLKDNVLIGDAYYSKSVVYFFRKQYKESLDITLMANEYIEKTNDDYLKTKIKYRIANIKLYLGFYEDAIILFKECESYFGKKQDYNNQKGYLKSLNGLAKCYICLGRYDLAFETLELGIKTAKEQNFDFDVQYFAKTQGINEYFKGNHALAVELFQQALPTIIENKDIPAESTLYFYLGKSFSKLKEQEKAMHYFFKVDTILADVSFITPELRENYEILIDYYKEQNDLEQQLEYVNKLLDADVVLNQNYKYLLSKIHKEYDTKSLLQTKNLLEEQLFQQQTRSWMYIGLASVSSVGLGLFAFLYYKKQRFYKQKFQALMQQVKKREGKKAIPKPVSKGIGIHQEIIEDLIKK